MRLNIFKKIIPAAALVCSLGFTSCVDDLKVQNINPQQNSDYTEEQLLNKIYSSFVLTGQQGPAGKADVQDVDEGFSDYFRNMWELQEFTTDEASWIWIADPGIPGLLHNTFDASNSCSSGLYYRIFFTITLCNYYLDQHPDNGDAERLLRRSEVRFIRALSYYYMMDLYGNATFTEHVVTEPGLRYTRSQYFDFVESELKDIETTMGAAGSMKYGRVDKVAAQLLLARLYLNAEVYTGTARWQDAKDYAAKVLNNGYYHLMTTGATNPKTGEVYSPYQMLFLADNDTNGAQYEAIYPVMHDGVRTQSYGGMHFLVLSTYAKPSQCDMDILIPSGTTCAWGKCTRVQGKLIDTFFGKDTNVPTTGVLADVIATAGDDRALFYTGGGYERYITDETNDMHGFACAKFRNVRSDGAATSIVDQFVDTDLPLMRIAEAYLTYAEAETRLNGSTADAAEKINALRSRAHAAQQTSYSLDDIRDEWSREFWFEGRRRIDLVRFGCFGGQSKYTWEYMGGSPAGSQFVATRNLFALPLNDLTNNPNLVQNPGY
jgi:hypothetical protein